MTRTRIVLGLLALAAIAINAGYWRDPWPWRRIATTVAQVAGIGPGELRPNEIVAGDGSFMLPFAGPDDLTIRESALRRAEEFAARFDSHALIVVHRGVIQAEWYGPGWGRDSLTQSQSMHKSLQALLVGIAVEEGLIGSIDEPVARYVGEWDGDPRGRITIRQLLTMSSGLAQHGFSLNPASDDFQWLFGSDMAPAILRTPAAGWAPGTQFDYNNVDAELLGIILQRASTRRYADLLADKIWRPMGGDPARVWLDHEHGNAHTSCCLMATAMDWARIGELLINRGELHGLQIVPAGWVDEMTAASPVHPWYGMQVWLGYPQEPNPRSERAEAMGAYWQSEPFLVPDVYYLSGHGAQRVYVVPSRDLVVVRLGPAMGLRPLRPGWDNAFLVNTLIRGMTPTILASNT